MRSARRGESADACEAAPAAAPALAFIGVSKSFGTRAAVEDVSLEIARGELFGLVGGNGAGKTTLLKCMLDFTDIDRGAIEIFGVSHRATRARREIAFLPERFNPPHYATGRDFLRYMARLHRQPYDEAQVAATFARVDLDVAALARPARAYSKGMTQKLGLAACLLSGKMLHVLDEPTSGLDPKARALLKRELRALARGGRTVFLTSHALADVEEICDRMAVLHAGRLRYFGTPEALRTRYANCSLEEAFLACIEGSGPA